jgi:hypothetical protein
MFGARISMGLVRPLRFIFVLLFLPLSAASLPAAEIYTQKQAGGKAVIRMEVDRLDGGNAVIALSREVKLTVFLEGPAPLAVVGDVKEVLEKLQQALTISGLWRAMNTPIPQMKTLPDGMARWELEYQLDTLSPAEEGRDSARSDPGILGKHTLQLPPLSFTDGTSLSPIQVTWQPIPIVVTTRVENPDNPSTAQVKGDHVPEDPEILHQIPLWRKVMLALAAGVLVASLLATAVLYIRWRRTQPAVTPGQGALREMVLLEAKGLAEAGQVERFHTELSDIVRNYLERQFRLRAPQQTTAEFLAAMQSWPLLPAAQQETLRTLLERCDLVKFARVDATPQECRTTAAMARQLVEYTQLAPGAQESVKTP